jgi:hypothetical protein
MTMAAAADRVNPKFKVPKTMAACADLLYSTQRDRYALQKQVDELAARETLLTTALIDGLPRSAAQGITGKLANATITDKEVVIVEDWDALHDYVLKRARKDPGVWALMQRRVGDTAVKELSASGVKVPGTKIDTVKRISLRKVG